MDTTPDWPDYDLVSDPGSGSGSVISFSSDYMQRAGGAMNEYEVFV